MTQKEIIKEIDSIKLRIRKLQHEFMAETDKVAALTKLERIKCLAERIAVLNSLRL